MKYILTCASSFLLLISCKKNNQPPVVYPPPTAGEIINTTLIENEPCDSLLPVGTSVYDSIACSSPCVNPSNPNEMAYIKSNINTTGLNLMVYNLTTGKEKSLFTGYFAPNQIRWSKTGWILFLVSDLTQSNWPILYKVKPDGSQLTQLLLDNNDKSSIGWSYTGDKYFCVRNSEMLLIRQTSTNMTVDSVPLTHAQDANQFGQITALTQNKEVVIYDMNSKTITPLPNIPADAIDYGYWMADGKRILYGGPLTGFGIYDVVSQTAHTFKPATCNSSLKYYSGITIIPGTNKFLTGIMRRYPIPIEQVNYTSHRIRVLKTDGSEEREIQIK